MILTPLGFRVWGLGFINAPTQNLPRKNQIFPLCCTLNPKLSGVGGCYIREEISNKAYKGTILLILSVMQEPRIPEERASTVGTKNPEG